MCYHQTEILFAIFSKDMSTRVIQRVTDKNRNWFVAFSYVITVILSTCWCIFEMIYFWTHNIVYWFSSTFANIQWVRSSLGTLHEFVSHLQDHRVVPTKLWRDGMKSIGRLIQRLDSICYTCIFFECYNHNMSSAGIFRHHFVGSAGSECFSVLLFTGVEI